MEKYVFQCSVLDTKYGFGWEVINTESFQTRDEAITFAKENFKRQQIEVHRIKEEDVEKDYAECVSVYRRLKVKRKFVEFYS